MGRKRKLNKYKFYTDSCSILINHNKTGRHEVLIDLKDHEKVKDFTWLIHYDRNGYPSIQTRVGEKIVILARHLLDLESKLLADHINRDPFNCKRNNLRITNHSGNAKNANTRKDSRTGYRGVYISKGVFVASFQYNKKRTYLGSFKTPLEAAKYYDAACSIVNDIFVNSNKIINISPSIFEIVRTKMINKGVVCGN